MRIEGNLVMPVLARSVQTPFKPQNLPRRNQEKSKPAVEEKSPKFACKTLFWRTRRARTGNLNTKLQVTGSFFSCCWTSLSLSLSITVVIANLLSTLDRVFSFSGRLTSERQDLQQSARQRTRNIKTHTQAKVMTAKATKLIRSGNDVEIRKWEQAKPERHYALKLAAAGLSCKSFSRVPSSRGSARQQFVFVLFLCCNFGARDLASNTRRHANHGPKRSFPSKKKLSFR